MKYGTCLAISKLLAVVKKVFRCVLNYLFSTFSTKTDIMFGKNNGLKTLMVDSGVDCVKEANRWKTAPECSQDEKDRVPDFTIAKLGDLLPLSNSI